MKIKSMIFLIFFGGFVLGGMVTVGVVVRYIETYPPKTHPELYEDLGRLPKVDQPAKWSK